MKKSSALIVSLLFILFACNHKPVQDTGTAVADTIVAETDTTQDNATGDWGPPQAFDYLTTKPITGATITATENNTTVDTTTTDNAGLYSFHNLVTGHTYTLTCTKTGYASVSHTVVFEGMNSLPPFMMKTL